MQPIKNKKVIKLKRRAPSAKHGVRRLAYPAEGIRQDIARLLYEFELCKSLRLTDFQKVWRRLNFGAMHAGREGHCEKRSFYEETFKIAIKFLLFPYTMQVKVGALYLLYSIYITQLCHPTVNIHITFEDFNQLLTLHKKLIEGGHQDADYVFRRMRDVDKAFTFVASYFCNFREEVYATESYADDDNDDDHNESPVKKNKRSSRYLLPLENTEPFQVLHHAPLTTLLGCRWLDETRNIHQNYIWSKETYLRSTPFASSKAETLEMSNNDVIGSVVDICKVPTPYPVSTVNGNVDQSFEPLDMNELSMIANEYRVEELKVVPQNELEAVELEKRILPLLHKYSAELYPDLKKQNKCSTVSVCDKEVDGNGADDEGLRQDRTWAPNNKVAVVQKSTYSTRSKRLAALKETPSQEVTSPEHPAPLKQVTSPEAPAPLQQPTTSPQRPAPPVEVSVVDDSGLPTPAVRTYPKKTRKSRRTKKRAPAMNVMLEQQGTTNIYKSDVKLDLDKPNKVQASLHGRKTKNLAYNMNKIKKDEVVAFQGVGPDSPNHQNALLGYVIDVVKKSIRVDILKSVRKQKRPYAGLLRRTGDTHWITETNIIYANEIKLTKENMIPVQVQRTIEQYYNQWKSEDDFMKALTGSPASNYDIKPLPQIQSPANGGKDQKKN